MNESIGEDLVGKWVTCICTGNRARTLTKGKKYQVLKIKPDASHLRIKGDNDRHQWYLTSNFDLAGGEATLLEKIHLQYSISNPQDDLIEVDLKFTDGSWRWIYCATPQYFTSLLKSKLEPQIDFGGEVQRTSTGELFSYFVPTQVVLLSSLSEENIWLALKHMDDQGELEASSKPYDPRPVDDPEDT